MSSDLWEQVPPEAQVIFLEMAQTIKRLEQRVCELEARLGMTPQNSSLPPSSQHPHAKGPHAKGAKAKRATKSKSKRKRGGQPGHKKHERALVPLDEVQEIIVLRPSSCRRCGEGLLGEDTQPWRQQVWELPEIKPIITEYQRQRLICACCGTSTCAALPSGVPAHQSGPRLTAFVALLMAHFRQSKRRVGLFCQSVLNIPCSTGLAVKLQRRATLALRGAYDELAQLLPAQQVLGIDESPTRQANHKAWLWTFVADEFTLFRVTESRKADILDELLTSNFAGIVTCDRAKMYFRLPRLQWCWAHLKRDFQALAECGVNVAQNLARKLLVHTQRLFRQWTRCRDGTITPRGLKSSLGQTRREVERLLLRGLRCRHRKTSGLCQELLHHRDRLWTFLDHDNVEPTNNASERALRHAVIWRKLSFGTQSCAGSRFVETLLSVIETCRQQNRDVFAFVTNSIQHHLAHQPPPSLLPGP
jgi:transposase